MPSNESVSTVNAAETERYYTVAEIAELWRVSRDTVRRLFEDEPGVIVIFKFKPETRPYRTLRIPQSVVDRVRNK
jgi:transcriptional regulator GlxA family with amidase domain